MSSGLGKTILQGTVKGKKKKRQPEEDVGRQCQRVDRNGPAQLEQQKPGQDGKGLLRIHLWCSNYFPRLWDRKEKNKYTKGMIRSSYTAVQADFFFFLKYRFLKSSQDC